MLRSGLVAEAAWIEHEEELRRLVLRLRVEPRIAVDTESNSMHAYFERVCLVQISIPSGDMLIDPFAVNIAPLAEVFSDPACEKVLHGADYDILCLKREFGFVFANLFDTTIAARVLGWEKYGLAAIIEEHFGRRIDKKYQRYDWGQRPLSPEALDYARLDTHHLLELSDTQAQELRSRDRYEEFEHACQRQTRVEPRPRVFDAEGFWRIKGARQLDGLGRAVLRALYLFRDAQARHLDRPPFRVLTDETMLRLATEQPTDARALGDIKGVPRPMLRRGGERLLAIVREGLEGTPPVPPRRADAEKPPRAVVARYETLRSWRKAYAVGRGMEPDVILGKATLMELALADPQTPEDLAGIEALDAWERQRYGAALLEVLTTTVVPEL